MLSDPFERLDEIAAALPVGSWMLVGGLMVHCHAQRAGIRHARPTDDADLVIELRVASYRQAVDALEAKGFARHLSLEEQAPFHRLTRSGEHVDVMVSEVENVCFTQARVPASRPRS